MKNQDIKKKDTLMKEKIEEILENNQLKTDYYDYPRERLKNLKGILNHCAGTLSQNNYEKNFVLYGGSFKDSYFVGIGFFDSIKLGSNGKSILMDKVIDDFDILYPDLGINNRTEEEFDDKKFELENERIFLGEISESLRFFCPSFIIVSQSLRHNKNRRIINYYASRS